MPRFYPFFITFLFCSITHYPTSAQSLAQEVFAAPRQDTSATAVAYVGPYRGGYRVYRKDLTMGILHEDLTTWIPFKYKDIQSVTTGVNPVEDFVFLGREGWHGGYALLDDGGKALTDYQFTYSERLRVFPDCVIDSPRRNQYLIYDRRGGLLSPTPYTAVHPHPALMAEGYPLLNVRRRGSSKLALFSLATASEVTGFSYDRINMVDPVIAPRTHLPLLEAYLGDEILLLRPDGSQLTDIRFAGVEDYNNWRKLRDYFGLGDDPSAEAIAWTRDMDVYVIYEDDRVVLLGRYQ